jgi:excisionase family DNA binding protein
VSAERSGTAGKRRSVRAGHMSPATVLATRALAAPARNLGRAQRARDGDGLVTMAGSPQSEGRLPEVRFLTVAEVATLMRVSKMTVYRLVHSGELTAVRVGRSFRVPEHAVHEYLRGAFQESA